MLEDASRRKIRGSRAKTREGTARTARQVLGGGSGLRPEDRCGESSVTNRRCQGRPWGLAVGGFDTEHGCEWISPPFAAGSHGSV